MNDVIVHANETITLLGGGVVALADLNEALTLAPRLVAADGGAVLAHENGLSPEAVIGDFDSLPATIAAQLPADRLHRIEEQDSTDFDKALRSIAAPLVLAVGFTGARIDHQLAAFHTLARYPDRPCVLIGGHELVCLAPPDMTLDLVAGDVVSLYPMGAVTGRSNGLEWPIDGLEFAPDRKIGTSNRATGPVRLCFDQPAMLLILPRHVMPQVVQHWQQQPARWPAL